DQLGQPPLLSFDLRQVSATSFESICGRIYRHAPHWLHVRAVRIVLRLVEELSRASGEALKIESGGRWRVVGVLGNHFCTEGAIAGPFNVSFVARSSPVGTPLNGLILLLFVSLQLAVEDN